MFVTDRRKGERTYSVFVLSTVGRDVLSPPYLGDRFPRPERHCHDETCPDPKTTSPPVADDPSSVRRSGYREVETWMGEEDYLDKVIGGAPNFSSSLNGCQRGPWGSSRS